MKTLTIEITPAAWAWLVQEAARRADDATPEIIAAVMLEMAIRDKQVYQQEAQQ